MDPVVACTFNACRNSDGKLSLEWQSMVAGKGVAHFRTNHESFEDLVEQLRKTLTRSSVIQ